MRFLDLAAAPGWKTTQIATILNNTGAIIAIDNNQIRADKLRFTIARQWVKNVSVMKIDARSFPANYSWELFDAMLFDAPCSAEWRINLNNEKTYDFVWPSNNKKNYYLQRDILKNNVPLLKEWGQLIYSTCTISPLENEAIVHFLLCNFPELEIVDIDVKILENIPHKAWLTHFWEVAYKKEVAKSVRILPSISTEWFFIAKFIKK
jgi:16S rRNA C967 or C1407 C5-methylase (RsmB/RsmF family)